jgi:WD40 repeat protein
MPEESLPLSLELHIDAVCQAFEAAWQATAGSTRPRIEDHMAAGAETERGPLLRELLKVELHYRRHEYPSLEEYHRRFPGHERLIDRLFEERLETTNGSTGGGDPAASDVASRKDERDTGRGHALASDWALPAVPGYEILGKLGQGGMGVVYRARDTRLDRVVALKMLRGGTQASDQDLARFRAEAEAVARLQHPNVVQVYEVGEVAGLPFFALEYVEGGSLASRLDGTPWPARRAAALVEVLARALHTAHGRGIVHRDATPGNVLMAADGTPKWTDFGLAKRLDAAVGQTDTGAILGTPGYLAPEAAAGRSKEVGPAGDVYGVGAILYKLLTGRPPFRAETVLATHQQVLTDEPVPPVRLNPKVPRDLETVCLKCLHKEPARRYASAAALADDLRRFQEGRPIAARPVGAWERGRKWVRRRPAMAGLVGLAVVALLALGGGLVGLWYSARLADANGRLTKALGEAEAAKRIAEQAREELRRVHYSRDLDLARSQSRENLVADAERILEGCPADLRGWEWHHVKHLCHADLLTLRGHTSGVWGVSFSPDCRRLATASKDGTAKVWDAQTGQEVLTLIHTGPVLSVCFSPDGRRLASASNDGTGKVCDAQTGQELLSLHGHTGPVTSVWFSPDGRRLASASNDNTVRVWDAQSGHEALTLKEHTAFVTSVCFSRDARNLASASLDGTAKVYDAQTGRLGLTFKGHTSGVTGVCFSPDGKHLASASLDGTAKMYDAQTGRLGLTFWGHTSGVTGLCFSPDSIFLATASEDGTTKVWDAKTGQQVRTLKGHTNGIVGVTFSHDGRRLATASEDQTAKVWGLQRGEEALTLRRHIRGVTGVSFSPDGQRLATASEDQTAKVWNAQTGQEALTLHGHRFGVRAVCFSPDGQRLATASLDETKVWDAQTGAELLTLRGHTSGATGVSFSPDGQRLATASLDGTAKVWDAQTGQELLTLKGHTHRVTGVSFSADGQRLATASLDGTVKVWDAD